MGFPLIDAGPIKLPAAAPTPRSLLCLLVQHWQGWDGMGWGALPACVAASHLLIRDAVHVQPWQGLSHHHPSCCQSINQAVASSACSPLRGEHGAPFGATFVSLQR